MRIYLQVIVFSERKREADASVLLSEWSGRVLANREDALNALIDGGELESGIADALCPHADTLNSRLQVFRQAMVTVAHACLDGTGRVPCLEMSDLPSRVEIAVPEGYAFYNVRPDAYAQAASRYYADARPRSAVVIGIRSIGTGLSAMVAAALEQAGCPVRSFTVRPRGHPFARKLCLAPELVQEWNSYREAAFIVVDEGPGLSGSSFASVASELAEVGIGDKQIIFLPSWDADGGSFLSAEAREIWPRHARWISPPPDMPGRNLSAGRWREVVYPNDHAWPAACAQHERLKYLDGHYLCKFAGLGKYGQALFDRALLLGQAGFIAHPVDFHDGFIRSEFIEGRPGAESSTNTDLLPRIRRYLQFLCCHLPSTRALPLAELEEMVQVNVEESLGPPWRDRAVEVLHNLHPSAEDGTTTEIDGRMFPHEWIETKAGYLKTDALEHHRDHFFPGPQDIAWDIAMTSVEFNLTPEQDLYLLNGCSLDPAKLRYYRVAYLSYRIGYCALAEGLSAGSCDAARFSTLSDRYRALLTQELAHA